MLSILIPAYNYNITKLVRELHRQATESMADFEIIVMEDGSTLHLDENAQVADLPGCRYVRLERNVGRSAIRNRLADEACYGHLLFLDCDAEVDNPYFIQKYLAFCHEECVVVGGTAYDEHECNPAYSLRLKYGREREARPANERSQMRYQVLATFNFMISKSIFNQIRFDESIRGYGYEDTVLSHGVAELGYKLIHIDNPLIHTGLDENEVFLQKAETGVRNLYALYRTGRYPYLQHESRLLHTFVRLQRWGAHRLCGWLYPCLRPAMRRNLLSPTPSLRVFDLYKLLYLCRLSSEK